MEQSVDASSDEDLVRLVQGQLEHGASASTAFHALYDRHAGRLLSYLSAQLGSTDALDALQEVWLRVWTGLRTFAEGHFRGWLFQIARNLVIDRKRRPRLLSLADRDLAAPRSADGAEEERHQLARCLEGLSHEMRELVRRRLRGESYPEIAQALGKQENHLYKLFHQAKKELKACVNGTTT